MGSTLYFVRHGQSMGNVYKTSTGHANLGLSDLGYKQAEITAKYLQDKNIDIIYSSDLIRAYDTACAFSKVSGIDIIKTERLREIKSGKWENKRFEDLIVDFPDTYSVWANNIGHAKPDGGESVVELIKRIYDIVEDICIKNDGKSIAIFTHATPIRAFFSYIENKSIDLIKDKPWANNASVSIAEYEKGIFKSIEYSIDSFLDENISKDF